MIKTFNCKETEQIFKCLRSRKLPSTIQQVALRKLKMLNRVTAVEHMRIPPANHLEKLQGKRAGQYSIRINKQWRICFRWQQQNAYDVEIVDYH